MEQASQAIPFCFLVLFVSRLLEQGATTEATATVVPPTSQDIPASPVEYDFAGSDGEKICLVLTRSTTAVIRACSSDANLKFSTNLSPSALIDLVQTRDNASMCQLLVITTNSDNLQEDEFDVFYDSSSLQIRYGPIGLSNPNDGHVLPFGDGVTQVDLLFRSADMTRLEFQVCRNGTRADFIVSLRQPTNCRVGTGAGGFSTHFEATVTDIGQNPLIGQNFTIISGLCDDTNAGVSFDFSVPEEVTSSTATILSTSSLIPSPTSTIMTAVAPTSISSSSVVVTSEFTVPSTSPTPSTPSPGRSYTIVIVVAVVIAVVLGIGVLVIFGTIYIIYIRKKRSGVHTGSQRSIELSNRDTTDGTFRTKDSSLTSGVASLLENTDSYRKDKCPYPKENGMSSEANQKKKMSASESNLNNAKKFDITDTDTDPLFRKYQNDLAKVKQGLSDVQDNQKSLNDKVDNVQEKVNNVQENQQNLTKKVANVQEKVDNVQEKVDNVQENQQNLTQRVDEVQENQQETDQKLDELMLEDKLSVQDQETEVEQFTDSNHTH